MKLSKTQQELYDAMKAGLVVHYAPYFSNTPPYFFKSGSMQKCSAPAKALLKMGLVEKYEKTFRGSYKLRVVEVSPPPPEQNK